MGNPYVWILYYIDKSKYTFTKPGINCILLLVNFDNLPKIEGYMKQSYMFSPESLPPAVKYHMLFENLPELPKKSAGKGRPSISRNSILKSLIYRNLRGITTLVGLEF